MKQRSLGPTSRQIKQCLVPAGHEHLQVVGGDDLAQLGLQQRRKVLRALHSRCPIARLWRERVLLRRRSVPRLRCVILLRLAIALLRREIILLRWRSVPRVRCVILLRLAIGLLRRGKALCRRRSAGLLYLRCQAPAKIQSKHPVAAHPGPAKCARTIAGPCFCLCKHWSGTTRADPWIQARTCRSP
jgi:hypothetical protein